MSRELTIAENLAEVKKKIAAAAEASGRSARDVRLIAVTKKVSVEKIREAFACGQRDFAENYVQEAMLKIVGVGEAEISWHFIGHLQSNKVKLLADRCVLIHSVDRARIVDQIAANMARRPQEILLEVNLAGEESKNGVDPDALAKLIEHAQKDDRVRLRGLMFMPPLEQVAAMESRYFAQARELSERMAKKVSAPHSLLELSMGTSHDFEVAIREGATLVRLGTSIFGARR